MDSAVMDRPLPGASPDMAQHNDQIVMQYLEQMDRQDILDSTRQSLATGYMQQSHLAITEIAYLLGFSDASHFGGTPQFC